MVDTSRRLYLRIKVGRMIYAGSNFAARSGSVVNIGIYGFSFLYKLWGIYV